MTTLTPTATKTCRLLYYGPAGAGKRENLRLINRSLPPQHRLNLASGDPERQIAFRLKTEKDGEWQVLVQSIDAGMEKYPTAGLENTPPFDGVIFVVSSNSAQLDHSLAALEGLKGYLESWNLDLMNVPVVIQYNGRDESQMLPIDRLESLLNPWGLLSFPASSQRDEGVRETLKSILGLTINHLKKKVDFNSGNGTPRPQTKTVRTPDKTLDLEYGPPIPGTDIPAGSEGSGKAIFNDSPNQLILPVQIHRDMLDSEGKMKILLEVEIID